MHQGQLVLDMSFSSDDSESVVTSSVTPTIEDVRRAFKEQAKKSHDDLIVHIARKTTKARKQKTRRREKRQNHNLT